MLVNPTYMGFAGPGIDAALYQRRRLELCRKLGDGVRKAA
jgi:hypothetical protein